MFANLEEDLISIRHILYYRVSTQWLFHHILTTAHVFLLTRTNCGLTVFLIEVKLNFTFLKVPIYYNVH